MSRVEPVATYRVQLTPGFGFDAVIGLVDHVRRLGASHVYLSPIAEAVPGSRHGYDVVDHTRVRSELGGAEGFERLLDAAAERRMAVLVDHVPNHVAIARPDLNAPWWALLGQGPSSPASRWFDVDWEAADGKVILPVLGAPLDDVLEAGLLAVDGEVLVVNGGPRLPLASGTAELPIVELVERQHYVLQHWRGPARNVRRFFTIDDLVAVRVEHEDVASVVDTLPARYASHPGFGGVRVDHVDGLADPESYLRRLRATIGDEALLYVEKILAPGERLASSWPVDGTTGYEFIRLVDHALLASDAGAILSDRWSEDSGDSRPFHAHQLAARLEVIDQALAPDLARLTWLAAQALGAADGADAAEVAGEIRRLTTELPRYRTYLPADPDAAALIHSISDGPVAHAVLDPGTPAQIAVRDRWQQLTGPVMAKGAEDRAFYRYLRLASLCEVGGDPGSFGITVDEFHAANLRRRSSWPRSLLASSTHDTKRSEDVRARSTAITWRAVARRSLLSDGSYAMSDDWAAVSRVWVRDLVATTGVDPVTASLAVQTAVCTPGLDGARLHAFLVKAGREAATRTSWEDPDAGYEERLADLATAAVATAGASRLGLDAIGPGISLAATTLRLTSPGVPDIYQGSEGFTFRLVDPDNRVAPDWEVLARAAADDRTVADLWAHDDPAVKTVLVRTLLDLRRRRSASFGAGGAYTPLRACPGVVAYGRGHDVVVAVRRGLAEVTGPLEFPPGSWHDVLDPSGPALGGIVESSSVVGSGVDLTLPVAVFELD